MMQMGLDEKWLVKEGKVAIRRAVIKTADASKDDQPTHAVPDSFDPTLLGNVDASSQEAAYASIPEVMAQRWATLREQVRVWRFPG